MKEREKWLYVCWFFSVTNCNQLRICPNCTLPSSDDSWARLQPDPNHPICRRSSQKMDGLISVRLLYVNFSLTTSPHRTHPWRQSVWWGVRFTPDSFTSRTFQARIAISCDSRGSYACVIMKTIAKKPVFSVSPSIVCVKNKINYIPNLWCLKFTCILRVIILQFKQNVFNCLND